MDLPMTVWRYIRDSCDWPMREKMAWWCLYSRRRIDGQAPHPGLRRLAADMGTTPNAATAAVDKLQKAGAIAVQVRAGEKGQNVYTLTPPWEITGGIAPEARGVHAYPKETRVSKTDTSPKQIRVSNLDTGGVSNSEAGGVSETATKRANDKEPMIKSQVPALPQSPGAPEKPATDKTRSKKEPDPDNKAAKPLVEALDTWLKTQGKPGVPSGKQWGGQVSIAANAIKSGAPPEELQSALKWGFTHGHWAPKLMAYGMKVLKDVWAEWSLKGRAGPSASGPRAYQSHFTPKTETQTPSGFLRKGGASA